MKMPILFAAQRMPWRKAPHALGVLISFCLIFASSQLKAADAPALKTAGKEITIPVVIRDKHDKFVTNLTKDDFTLTEDGKPQTIRSLAPASGEPITVGLVIDTSQSQRNNIDQIRTTSKHFLEQILTNPKDKAFVLHFDHEVELLQDTTAAREKLISSLDLLSTASSQQARNDSDSSQEDSHRHVRGPSDLVYDSIYLAADELMRKQQGRKILVLISDGVDHNSKVSAVSAIEATQQANTVIYAIYLKGEELPSENNSQGTGRRRNGGSWPGGGGGWPGGGGGGGRPPQQSSAHVDGRKNLDHISSKTGGHIFEANKKENLDRAYDDLVEELHSQFLLTYAPDQSGGESFHQVSLVPKKKDLNVQIQDGYYPGQ
jgi:VWFA-related protein